MSRLLTSAVECGNLVRFLGWNGYTLLGLTWGMASAILLRYVRGVAGRVDRASWNAVRNDGVVTLTNEEIACFDFFITSRL